jgi:enoyl-CoA hydratase/carnithine racemase
MNALLERLATSSPVELIGFAAVVLFSIVALTALWCWRRVRLTQAATAWRLALLQREFSAEETERLLHAADGSSASDGEEAIAEVARALGENLVAPEVVEQVMSMVRNADLATQKTVAAAVQAFREGADEQATAEQILATVRGLCGPVPVEAHKPAHV